MFYVRRHLAPGERIIHQTSLHWVSFVRQLLFFSMSVVVYPLLVEQAGNPLPGSVLLGIGGSALIVSLLRFWLEEFVVTDRRVFVRRGLLARSVYIYPLNRIETLDVHQSLTGRLMGFGTIELHTASEGDGRATRRFVHNPEQWRESVLRAIDAFGRRRAVEPGAVVPPAQLADPAERLRRLEALAAEGLISQEEYQTRRAQILDQL